MAESRLRNFTPASPLIIIVGNYGSGKTEVAVNLAVELASRGQKVSIADLDIVNPYFRCREAREVMDAHGIRVVMPPGSQQYADLPIVVPEIKGMLHPTEGEISVFDVGGDDVGATLLSSFYQALGDQPYSLLQVVNSKRPFTDSVEGCLKMKEAIERSSRLRVTGLISNSHLMDDTTEEVVLEGLELARAVEERAGVPIAFVTAMGELARSEALQALDENVFELTRIMLPPWLITGQKHDRSVEEKQVLPAGRTKPIFRP